MRLIIGAVPATALVVGVCFGLVSDVAAVSAGLAMAVCAAGAWVAWGRQCERIAMVALVVAFACAASALTTDAKQRALSPSLSAERDPIEVRARLLEDAAVENGFTVLPASIDEVHVGGVWRKTRVGVTMTVSGREADEAAAEWRAGRVIQTFATFRRPARYLDEGVPDFARDLALAGTAYFGSVKSASLIGIRARGNALQERAASVRAHVRRSVDRWVAPHDKVSAAIVTAVLIGDRTGLPDDIRLRLQAAGTYHVIAISGGNIAILAGLVIGLLRICGINGRPAAALTLLLLLSYAQVVTPGASVWRATLMAAIYLGARLIDHRSPPWHALAMSAVVLVCIRPLEVRDVGFILTFGATAALLEGARRLARPAGGKFRGWLHASLAASLAVEVALLPISASMFSRVTSAGLLLNLASVPLMGLVQVGGLLVSMCADVPAVAQPSGWVAHAASAVLIGSARLVDVAPWLSARVPPPPLALVVGYYVGLAAVLFGTRRRRWCGVAVVLASAVSIVSGEPAGWLSGHSSPGRLRVTVFDVGQGDSTLLELPDLSRVLVDAGGIPFGGGIFDVGSRVLAPALWARGIRGLNTIVITHGDPDHIGGAGSMIDDFDPGEVWEGVPVKVHAPLQALLRRARREHIRVRRRYAGDSWQAGAAHVRVLHPPVPDWERPRVRNDDSVVLEIRFGDVAVLLPGDVGAEVERAVLPQVTPARYRILKVGHHGSRTSTSQALLDAWRPQIAIISCGRDNPFGHPAPEVLARLASIGARLYRTDVDGEISVETDGVSVEVHTFMEKRK